MCSESHVVQPVDFYTKRSLPSGFASAMLLLQRRSNMSAYNYYDASFTHKRETSFTTTTKTIVQQRSFFMFFSHSCFMYNFYNSIIIRNMTTHLFMHNHKTTQKSVE